MGDIAERLIAAADMQEHGLALGKHVQLMREAATDLAALEAENERLRAALEPFAALGMFLSGDDAYVEFQRWDFKLTVGDFRRARAALQEMEHG